MRYKHVRNALLGGLSMIGLLYGGGASAINGEKVVLEQAEYWLSNGRGDLAISGLQRLLASDPTHQDAL